MRTPSPATLLPWVLLLNSILVAAAVHRYVAVRDADRIRALQAAVLDVSECQE